MNIKENTKPTFEPYWNPLKELEEPAKASALKEMMYMGGHELEDGTVVHTFKHRTTRNYINLSDDGRAWSYTGDGYIAIDELEAVKSVILDSI